MPLEVASFSIAAPDALSRLTIMRTLTPLLSMLWAMVRIVSALPWAFWMSQFRLSTLHWACRAGRSAPCQRAEDLVSGRMMPTFAPLPSILPPAALEDAAALEEPPAALEEELSLDLLDEHAPRASTAA